MTTMTHNELTENELNLVNGGADGDEEKSLLDILNDYDYDERRDLGVDVLKDIRDAMPRPHNLGPENAPLHVEVYPYTEM